MNKQKKDLKKDSKNNNPSSNSTKGNDVHNVCIQSNELKDALTPKQIVQELDRFVVGQNMAKKAVAIALRNRYRRKSVAKPLRDEIVPKNILMVGPTGVGKTEIARRLAHLAGSPFIKVEATKFTEVGYVGRDVESVIRDLLEISINLVRKSTRKLHEDAAKAKAEERVLNALVGEDASSATKEKFREMLRQGHLDDKEIEITITEIKSSSLPTFDIPGMPGGQMGIMSISDMLGKALGNNKKEKLKKMTVKESYPVLLAEEADKLIDEEEIISEAKNMVENDGIVFIDEIDKIASNSDNKGKDVSREGVQRDLLPLIEGTTVSTKHGSVETDHMLFIASGAFYMSKPSDLLPELQGRLPIRVELSDLTEEDMVRILEEPESSLVKQYTALINTEGVSLSITKSAIKNIAKTATTINKEVENIGARRLHTIMEKLLEEISFNSPESPKGTKFMIDDKYVDDKLGKLTKQLDLSKFIL